MGEFRKRILIPAALPLAAFGVIGLLALAFSRVLLAVPEAGSTTLAFLLAGMILAVAAVLAATGSRMKRSQKTLVLTAGIATLVAGVASAQIGIREIEIHAEEIHIAAEGIAFDTEVLHLPADAPLSLIFENRDEGIPHDVDIYPDDTYTGDALFDGEDFPGVATQTYSVPPIATGAYAFRCSIHPTQMTGAVEVSAEGPDAAGGHGAPSEGQPDPSGDDEPAPQPPDGETAPPAEEPGPAPGTPSTTVIAEGIAFDVDGFELPADVPTAIEFENRDAGIPHNIEIFADNTFTGDPLFKGEIFSGEETRTYQLEPIAAGSYAFRCVVHPTDMTGTATFT